MLTGVPIVSIGPELARLPYMEACDWTFSSDDYGELRSEILKWINWDGREEAGIVMANQRKEARELFGVDVILPQWKEFFKSL
jgi:hypothetical protein